jgi:hypothetical protein
MRDNNSFVERLGIIIHNVFPAYLFEQFIVFVCTLLLAGMFSRAFASVHLYSSYAQSAADQQNSQSIKTAQTK